jgi:uncharacterized ion transporter superfamily protein YfcC
MRKLQPPNVFVLIFTILVLVGLMTWVLPGGEYAKEAMQTAAGTKQVVLLGEDGSPIYTQVPAVRQGPWEILKAPIRGMEQAADVVAFILLVGGAFGVLSATGAILAAIRWLTSVVGGRGRFFMIPVLMFTFSLGGAFFGMAEEVIPFVLLTVPLAVSLRFDVTTGVAIPFIGSQAGFAAAFVNPFTLGIAKGITGQPIDEGQGYRMICWVIVTSVCAAAVSWHAYRVSQDPQRSPTPELDARWRDEFEAPATGEADGLRPVHVLVLVCFAASMVLLAVGALQWDWYITELSGLFIGMAVLCGLAGKLRPGQIADAFVEGAKDLVAAAVLVGVARGILVVAEDGRIIDTILHGMAGAVEGLGPLWTTECMFGVQTVINFFVPSGSGQAALTMPVMSPLAQIVGVHQENAILAYQFGDGFTNMIIPTNAVLVGVLSMAKMEYGTWFRWMIKLQLFLFALGMVFLALSPFHSVAP